MYYTANFFTLTPATPPYFSIHDPPVPEALPEVPAETGETIEEAELEEVADAEICDSSEIARQFVVGRLLR